MTDVFNDDGLPLLLDALVSRLNEQDVSGAVKVLDMLGVIGDTCEEANVPDEDMLTLFGWAVFKFLVGAHAHPILGPLVHAEIAARRGEIARKITEVRNEA